MSYRNNFIKQLITISLLFLIFIPINSVTAGGGPGQKPALEAPYFEPSSPAKTQKKVIPAEGVADTNIGVYIWQQDNLQWRVDGSCNGQLLTNNSLTNKPVSSLVCVDLDLSSPYYIPSEWKDKNGERVLSTELVESTQNPIYMDNDNYYTPGLPILVSVDSFTGKRVKFTAQIGGAIEPQSYGPYNGDKFNAVYNIYTDLYWRGRAEVTKEISLTDGGQLSTGQTKQLTAKVKTKNGDGNFGSETTISAGNGTTTWESSNPGVARVNSNGLVTAQSKGTTTIKVLWEKDGYRLTTTTTVTVGEETGGGGGEPGGGGACTYTLGTPSQVSTTSMSDMNPNTNGVIRADSRGSEKFDVLQGIPTSESLYTNAFADNYLFKHVWAKMSGTITYECNVDVTYALEWTVPGEEVCPPEGEEGECTPGPPEPKTDTADKPYSFTFTRNYSYWQINNLEVYEISRADMSNDALPSGKVTMNPSGYTSPSLVSQHDPSVESHVTPGKGASISYTPPVLKGGLNSPPEVPDDTELLKGMAEGDTPEAKVKNDKVVFNGSTIMNDAEATKDGPTPSNIPSPSTIGQNVLYKPNNMISSTFLNRSNIPSSGRIYYNLLPGNVNGGSNTDFAISGINSVTVHTPTVVYANASDDAAHNQKTIPNYSRRAFILDRPFTVSIPTSGQHRNIPGYGNRDYAKYIKLKQVRFEFDVYSADRNSFYPANTWIEIPVTQIETTFYLPKWVDEGNYTVYYRSFAENSPNTGFTTEQDANLNLANHVATDTVPVEVIGRIYDFKITDIADPNWETVFRTGKGSSIPKGTSYSVGPYGIDAAPNGSVFPYQLPIRRGSHPLANYKSVAVKSGYHFKFEMKTKGNLFGDKDAVRITPKFYFQDNNPLTPANRVEVDLYYHSQNQKFIKIGSTEDVERREITMNTRLRNVPYTDIISTAGSIYDLNSGWTMTRDQYINSFVKRSTEPTYVGGYDVQILPSPLRTFINTFERPSNANATPARVNASEQKWYGEYSLPAAVYAVPKGTDLAAYGRSNRLNDKSPIFLKNGYITVNFNIETIPNANLDNPHLQYIHGPLNNQWWDMEGFDGADGTRDHVITDPYGVQFLLQDGDVVFYDANKSSYDDYRPYGTH
ncbi:MULTISPECIES: DUF5704 domain-containing protein [unclassified Paenibacillus]|uniref:DUF5704 domain-containing protein n=1 Tax=Paenibacillus provencensis TaxID=441151 RepID=A0ABW3Q3Y7_9BACL|nr:MULTISPECIES: DUF5704 domain-containing protein [unclassified Paenibacillus]MCM3130602.1 DUF5704 domain-containing protein [Paenibacillus sp. MER 78]SDX74779.1 Ig-like domain (group 2) [Paenibacillus sp. PDC88]SFS89979.1 Ig-like domain (group 2) [Paenibacillus sp. 453mf]